MLGNETGATAFAQAADRHATAIHARFWNATINGYVDTRQGHLILALFSGSVPPSLRDSVLDTLRHEIHVRQGGHIDTGLTTTYFMYLVRGNFSADDHFCVGLLYWFVTTAQDCHSPEQVQVLCRLRSWVWGARGPRVHHHRRKGSSRISGDPTQWLDYLSRVRTT